MEVDGKFRLFATIFVIFSTLVAYSNSLFGEFQFDDYNVIVYNPTVHSLSNCLSDLGSGIRPLLKLSFALNWAVDQSSFGFHLINLLIHLINIFLVNSIMTHLLSKKFPNIQLKFLSFMITLVFALHPVNTEAVTYIAGRSVSLMALFYLLSIFLYLRGKIVLSLIFFIMAFTSKEIALTLPFTLLLIDVFFGDRINLVQILRRQAFYWTIFIIILGAILFHPHYRHLLLFSFQIRSIEENLLLQVNGVFYLLQRLIYLNGMNIDPDLPTNAYFDVKILLKFLALTLLLLGGIWSSVKRSFLGFGLLWFFLHLIPTNSFIPRLDIANDRQLYLASLGLFLCFALIANKVILTIFAKMTKYYFTVQYIFITVLMFLLGTFTYLRNLDYLTEVSLWEDTVKKSPNKARVYNNLGYAYFKVGKYHESERAFKNALMINPNYKLAAENLEKLQKLLELERGYDNLMIILIKAK